MHNASLSLNNTETQQKKYRTLEKKISYPMIHMPLFIYLLIFATFIWILYIEFFSAKNELLSVHKNELLKMTS